MSWDLSPLAALLIFELVDLTSIFQPQSDLYVRKMKMSRMLEETVQSSTSQRLQSKN